MGLYNKYGNNNDRMIVSVDPDSGAVTTCQLADWYNETWRGKQIVAKVTKAQLKKLESGAVMLEKDSAPFLVASEDEGLAEADDAVVEE